MAFKRFSARHLAEVHFDAEGGTEDDLYELGKID